MLKKNLNNSVNMGQKGYRDAGGTDGCASARNMVAK